MSVKGRPQPQATRERIRRGVQRHYARRQLAPSHVDQWLSRGQVTAELVPIVAHRRSQAIEMATDLGGIDVVSSMQRAVIETWLQAQVSADVLFSQLVRDGDDAGLDRLATFLNSARAALQAVGLLRRERDVTPNLRDYLGNRSPAAQAAPSATIVVPADSDADHEERGHA